MIITFTQTGFITCAVIMILAQVAKVLLKYYNLKAFCKFIPVSILLVSFIVYSIILKEVGMSALASAFSVTAISCYTFDCIKGIAEFIESFVIKDEE